MPNASYIHAMTELTQERIGRRLKWFRESRDLTQHALSAQLGFKDRQTMSDIEAGKRKVTPEELVAITTALGVTLDEVLDPFQLVGEGGFSFRMENPKTDDLDAFTAKAGRWIATYRELGRQTGVEPAFLAFKLELTLESSFEDAAASAEALRAHWGLGDVPAEELELAIERQLGALVLYVDAPPGVSGAASYLPGLPTILINRHEPRSRRLFDLTHELFHVMTWHAMPPARVESWEPSATKGNRMEQLANVFAASLLMPEAVVRSRWADRKDADPGEWMLATARALRVSPVALQWRLVNLGLLRKSQMLPLKGELPDPFAPPPPLFSVAFVARVHDAVEDGRLSVRRAAALLGLAVGEFANLCRSYGRPLSYDA